MAPLLVLAGVAAAFLPLLDPAYRLAVAAPFSGFTLLLARAVSALAAALVPVAAAAFVVPGPGWLPVALLLPSLALCAFALAAATVMDPRGRRRRGGALWAAAGARCWRRLTCRWRIVQLARPGRVRRRAAAPPRWCCWRAVTASSSDG